jgi:hypothetical protein
VTHEGVPGRLGDLCLIYGFWTLDIHLFTLHIMEFLSVCHFFFFPMQAFFYTTCMFKTIYTPNTGLDQCWHNNQPVRLSKQFKKFRYIDNEFHY